MLGFLHTSEGFPQGLQAFIRLKSWKTPVNNAIVIPSVKETKVAHPYINETEECFNLISHITYFPLYLCCWSQHYGPMLPTHESSSSRFRAKDLQLEHAHQISSELCLKELQLSPLLNWNLSSDIVVLHLSSTIYVALDRFIYKKVMHPESV